jgi:epsilon-lactone hydrolase
MVSDGLQTVIEMLRAGPRGESLSIEQMRRGYETLAAAAPPPEGATFETVDAGGIRAEWVRPDDAADDRIVFYLHGGGYVLCSPLTHRALVTRIARACGARALTVDYRLGPEHPFPAAVEDAVAAYGWLLARGADPARVVIAGDSAGGGLAIATLAGLRDGKVPLPRAAVCLSPWTDLTLSGHSMKTNADVDPMTGRAVLAKMAAAYLAGADPTDARATPLNAILAGLPPLLVHVGSAEVLLDDATRLAARARAAGVDVTLEVWDDMIHVWHAFAPLIPEAEQAIAKIGAFVRARWA